MKRIKPLLVGLLALFVLAVIVVGPHIFAAPFIKYTLFTVAVLPFLAVTSTTNRFQDVPCSVVVSNNFDTHGTITRASVAHLTPAQLESLFRPSGLFADMDSWFRTSFEMKACGIKINGFYDWVMSSYRSVGDLLQYEKLDRGPSLLKPFVMGRQDSVINKEYWAITAGWQQNAYVGSAGASAVLTTADLALGATTDRVVRVVSRYGLDMDAKWFLSRDRIFIMGRANGVATSGQWKVLAAEVNDQVSYVDVLITSENAGSTTPFDSAPTSGVLLSGGNNVSDFESWCNNRPTLDPRKRVPFWWQTMRRARAVDSEYKAVYARLMESNEYFRQFGDLPLSERNRQDEELFQRNWLNSFLFGKKISANQTLANWQSLEAINTVTSTGVDPGQGGKIIAYRANMVGLFEQLQACSRVFDLQNSSLNFYEWLQEVYRIKRARMSQGKVATSQDWFLDGQQAADMETGFFAYYKNEYGDVIRFPLVTEGENKELGFNWRSFKVKFPIGTTINLVTHEFFDDYANAFAAESIASRGRMLLCLDIGKPGPKGGTIYPGMISSNRKVRTLGELEQLARIDPTFACVMETVTEEITLVSETCTAVCECPANSAWIFNVASGAPNTGGQTYNPSYTNLY